MIAFFHTSEKNIERFTTLMQQIAPDAEIKHFVNSFILEDALEKGLVTPSTQLLFEDEITKIAILQPQFIICTCSTFGEACKQLHEKGTEVKRIDYPIARYLVEHFSHIGLAYTAQSTLLISKNLLFEVAKEFKKTISIQEIDCTSSWHYFQEGKLEDYSNTIANSIKEQKSSSEAIFLAQASMEGAKEFLNIDTEVVSSPKYGVIYYTTHESNVK